MKDIYFTFGPNRAFFFDGPKCFKSDGIPQSILKELREAQSKKITCLAIEDRENPSIFVTYVDKDGKQRMRRNSAMKSRYKLLNERINAKGKTKCRVSFGQKGHYFAWSSHENYNCYRPEPKFKPLFKDKSKIQVACLGVDDSYFIMQTDGKFWFDFKDNYETLSEIFKELHHGDVEFLAINPFRVGEFFLLLANETAIFQVPLSYRKKLEAALQEHGISCQALATQQIEEPADIPKKAKRKSFAKALTKHVLGQAVGGIASGVAGQVAGVIITGVASALVGAVACVIM